MLRWVADVNTLPHLFLLATTTTIAELFCNDDNIGENKTLSEVLAQYIEQGQPSRVVRIKHKL